jgi:hypothetical protein
MTWRAYEVIFRLRTPLHVGWRKVSNLQMTRHYFTGRNLWGALTMRLTRNAVAGPAIDSGVYQTSGNQVHEHLAFTYFYVALREDDRYAVVWPWENESAFRRRFLSSYASAALAYPQQSADEGLLHEVEFITPMTRDDGKPVFLKGYIFERQGCNLAWRPALKRLQIGGERGYGWGDLAPIGVTSVNGGRLFDCVTFDGSGARPVIHVQPNERLLAHTLADGVAASGAVEPLVGREWQSYAGQGVAYSGVAFAPGAVVEQEQHFTVERHGVWARQR